MDDEGRLASALEQAVATMPTDPRQRRGHQYDAGLAWVHHAVGRGGLGVSPRHQRAVNDALRAAGVPAATPSEGIGVALVGPTIAVHGDDESFARFLRAAFTGDDRWCQLFSEPEAGSDLAGVRCRAERDGDRWLVNGTKVWTTNAHLANRGLLLARTNPLASKRDGISCFALDMASPGVDVRPLRQMTGQAEFSEIFLTNVVVPHLDIIGREGAGWTVARTTLTNERSSIGGGRKTRASGGVPRGAVAEALRLWRELPEDQCRETIRDELVRLWCEGEVHRLTNLRMAAAQSPLDGSLSKLAFTKLNQRAYELCMTVLGANAMIEADYEFRRVDHLGYAGPVGSSREYFLRSRANSIEGGTTEIQRNIIAERSLGLPRERFEGDGR